MQDGVDRKKGVETVETPLKFPTLEIGLAFSILKKPKSDLSENLFSYFQRWKWISRFPTPEKVGHKDVDSKKYINAFEAASEFPTLENWCGISNVGKIF